ncbi:MAG: response regulator transcription factor [Nevskia sp.]|nr:response regulator transcription factor [Nevskia sp.]
MRILVVEDHPITRMGVVRLAQERWPQTEVTEARGLQEALQLLAAAAFDAIVLDLNLPDASGLEGVVRVRRAQRGTPLLVLSAHAERAYAMRCLQEGAQGYLNKERAPEELAAALECVLVGRRYITASLAEELAGQVLNGAGAAEQPPHQELSAQEYRVMLLLVEGHAVAEIGARMYLSPKTVSTYRARILDKLGLQNNVELTKYCIAHRLIGNARSPA